MASLHHLKDSTFLLTFLFKSCPYINQVFSSSCYLHLKAKPSVRMWLPVWTRSLMGARAAATGVIVVVVGSRSAAAPEEEKTKKGKKITGE